MFENEAFAKLVADGHATGEVIASDRFIVHVSGLGQLPIGALILFENGEQGLVRQVNEHETVIFNLTREDVPQGMLAVVQDFKVTTPVSESMIGRVINVLGEPLDGKGPIGSKAQGDVFAEAPAIVDRQLLTEHLVTGVAIVDTLFPIALGQRMAILGDNKSGKTTFLNQLTQSQAKTERVVVNVQIAKRKVDVDKLLETLQLTGAIDHCIIVVASVFDSLTQSYLAPYVGCAIGEHLWRQGKDVVMIYDDLSNHAKVYRELSLLAEVNPGRDSYPGDMFFAHSSLLERAGRLKSNGATMTALPVVSTPNEDITAYLPTNAMSITDGQVIFDMAAFRAGIRPAVNVGLSVSRVGGRVQNPRQNALTAQLLRRLAEYREASEFSHFSSELATQSQTNLTLGKSLYEAFRQLPEETWEMPQQEVLLGAVLKSEGRSALRVGVLKAAVKKYATDLKTDQDYEEAISKVLAEVGS